MSVTPQPSSTPDPGNLQGNLVGFNKDHVRLVFVTFPDELSGKAFVQGLVPQIATASDVLAFNALYKQVHDRGAATWTIEATWVNIALTAAGLGMIGAAETASLPPELTQGMAAQAASVGDVDDSAPANWLAPFTPGTTAVHAMIIIASDDSDDLNDAYATIEALIATTHVTELGHQDGNVRPDPNVGHEHFGFKDGISQPGIAGVTEPSKTGTDTVATGEFVIGYPDSDGNISGQATPPGPPPQEGQPGYPGPGTPGQPALPDWATDGSFLVYRRLRQDVGGFNQSMGTLAQQAALNSDQMAAKLVGRWPSGAPMEPVPTLPPGVDPSRADPAPTTPAVLGDDQINAFDYSSDADGHAVPRAAHIRKMNPRASTPPGPPETSRHRLLRRGIPYGPDFQPTEPPYSQGPINDDRDRGLLFLCYQASISRGFMFVQQSWSNSPDFPQAGDGVDPIISQATDQRPFTLPPQNVHLTMARWVTTVGGEFFFAPSIPALKQLSS